MKFIRTIIWFIYFWIYLLMMTPSLKKVDRLEQEGKIEEHDALASEHVTKWARSLLRLAGAKVTIKGEEHLPEGAAVYMANHQGNFDVPIVLGYLEKPKAMMSKIEVKKLPLIRSWMRHIHCIFVDRKNVRQSMNSLNDAADLVKKGYSVCIFPEGTRSKGGPIGEFKSGGFRIATKTGAPIVPVRIEGSFKLMEANGNWIKPAEVTVTILPPVEVQGLSKEEMAELPERVRSIIAQVG